MHTEEQLKKIIGRITTYLDIHSVTGGFRKVALIGLITHYKSFNCYAQTKIPRFKNQINFLQHYTKDYQMIKAWEDKYFIAEKSQINKINNLLERFTNPTKIKDGERRLGLILGYPECCVNAYCEYTTKFQKNLIIPFMPCSSQCRMQNLWIDEYKRLANLYNVNISEKYFQE